MIYKKRVELFFSRVRKIKDCWVWTGAFSHNYGQFFNGKQSQSAHRFSYEYFNGPINSCREMHIDHLCKNTKCVNPAHLEYVTRKTNLLRSGCPSAINARKTHCINGHELSGDNLRIDNAPFGKMRTCRACKKNYGREYQKQIRAKKRIERLKNPAPPKIWPKKTHCIKGHPFDELNTYVHSGKQNCRTCRKNASERFRNK